MIQFSNVSYYYKTKTYYKKALNNVTFYINKNEFVLVTGESGGGKSTLGKIISGQVKDYEGSFLVNGEKVTPQFFENVEYISSKHHLIPQFTVLENLLHRTSDIKEIENWLQVAGLQRKKNTKLKNLSGGETQRVSVIASLMTSKEVIIADEPTQGLDAKNAKYIAELFLNVKNKTIIYITHDLASVSSNINRSFFIKNGKLEEKVNEALTANLSEPEKGKTKIKLNVFTQIKRMPYLFTLNCFSFILAISFMVSAIMGLNILNNENKTKNENFSSFYENRLLITKKDGSSFSSSDKLKLENYSGELIYNDIFLDGYMSLSWQDKNLDGNIYIEKQNQALKIMEGETIQNADEVLMAVQREELVEMMPLLNQYVTFSFDYSGFNGYNKTLKVVGFLDKEELSLQASRFYVVSNELIDELESVSGYNNLLLEVFVNDTLMASYNQARIQIMVDNTLADDVVAVPFIVSETEAIIKLSKGSETISREVSIISSDSVLKINETTLNFLLNETKDHQASLIHVNNINKTMKSLEKQGFMVQVINKDYGAITTYFVLSLSALVIFSLFIALDMKITNRLEKSLLWHGIEFKRRLLRKIIYYVIAFMPSMVLAIIILNIFSKNEDIVYRFLFGFVNTNSIIALILISLFGIIFTTSMYMLKHKKAVKL